MLESDSFIWDAVRSNILSYKAIIKGIYRLTLISPTQFNISSSSSYGVNNISTIIDKDATERFTITSTDANLARGSVTWYIEFIAELSK
jgi:ribonuclease HI